MQTAGKDDKFREYSLKHFREYSHCHLANFWEFLLSGDAYVVVGWLISDDEDNCRLDDERMATVNQNLCLDMLKVADGLLSCLCEHRDKTGVDLHARIGIATGEVISGVLGLLQPRFCVFGEGMCRAAELEQTGPVDAVHCSEEFLDYVDGTQDMVRRASAHFSADIRYNHICSRRDTLKREQLRRKFKAAALVSQMVGHGRLHKHQFNMMAASPAEATGDFLPMQPVNPSSTSTPLSFDLFGLVTSFDAYGNFPSWYRHDQHLRSIDENGKMLVMRGNSGMLDGHIPQGELSIAHLCPALSVPKREVTCLLRNLCLGISSRLCC